MKHTDHTLCWHCRHAVPTKDKITYILNGWGIKNGYVVLGIKEIKCNNCVFYHTCSKRNVVCDNYRPRQTEED